VLAWAFICLCAVGELGNCNIKCYLVLCMYIRVARRALLVRSVFNNMASIVAVKKCTCKLLLQVIKPSLLKEGFEALLRDNVEVTDDVSIIEAIGKPVKMTQGSYTNIKVC
jgi:hypothetical protein